VKAGDLKEQIIIQHVTDTVATSGAVTESWATFATVRCSVEPMTARELFSTNHVSGEHIVKFRIRYLAGILLKMRISWNSGIYDLQSILNPGNDNRELLLIGVKYEQ
jgi:SPP1 family predicted phage head-tail adaptor